MNAMQPWLWSCKSATVQSVHSSTFISKRISKQIKQLPNRPAISTPAAGEEKYQKLYDKNCLSMICAKNVSFLYPWFNRKCFYLPSNGKRWVKY